MANNDLKDVAGTDVLDTLADGVFVVGLRHVRRVVERHFAAEGDVVELQRLGWRFEQPDQPVDLLAGVVVGLLQGGGAFVTDVGQGEDDDRFLDMVENDHVVVECKPKVGQLAVVAGGVREVFDVANRVVTGIANCPADKRRQLGQVADVHRVDLLAKRFERVGALGSFRLPGVVAPFRVLARATRDRYAGAVGLDVQKGFAGEEAVATDFFAADDTLEQAGGRGEVEFLEGRKLGSTSRSPNAGRLARSRRRYSGPRLIQ